MYWFHYIHVETVKKPKTKDKRRLCIKNFYHKNKPNKFKIKRNVRFIYYM